MVKANVQELMVKCPEGYRHATMEEIVDVERQGAAIMIAEQKAARYAAEVKLAQAQLKAASDELEAARVKAQAYDSKLVGPGVENAVIQRGGQIFVKLRPEPVAETSEVEKAPEPPKKVSDTPALALVGAEGDSKK